MKKKLFELVCCILGLTLCNEKKITYFHDHKSMSAPMGTQKKTYGLKYIYYMLIICQYAKPRSTSVYLNIRV